MDESIIFPSHMFANSQALRNALARNEPDMTLHHFQLIDPAGGRRELKSLRLADPRAVWREIDALAHIPAAKGSQIRVVNEAGGIVVLIGVSTARSLNTRCAA